MTFQIRYKVWLENKSGQPIIGEGRLQILRAIRKTGSILKAAQKLGLPYRKVWGKIKDAEHRCGFKIVESSQKGSKLTHEGKCLLDKYAQLNRSCKRSAKTKFEKLFSSREANPDNAEVQSVHLDVGRNDQ